MDVGNLILWGIGIVVSVVLAVMGHRALKSYRNQNQKVDGRSVGIQSGRDTNIKKVKK